MTTVDYASLIDGIDVIGQDAYRIGRVEGVCYDPSDWKIIGLVVKCDKRISELIGAGSSKSRIMMKPDSFVLNDVLLLADDVEGMKSYVSQYNESYSAAGNLLGKPVTTGDDKPLGTVKAVKLNLDDWFVQSFVVKLDKEAYAPLNLKKGLFSKDISGITTDHVDVTSENIRLKLTMEQVRDVAVLD